MAAAKRAAQLDLDGDTEDESGSAEDSVESEFSVASTPRHEQRRHKAKPGSRALVLVRNAEQMDKVFPEWTHRNFRDGKYVPSDMNQPQSLWKRKVPQVAYELDPPLTEMGTRIAALMGKAMADQGLVFSTVYCSPALRCVQTTQQLLRSQLYDLQIRVEPALYDFGTGKDKELPMFLSVAELAENRVPVDKGYKPLLDVKGLAALRTETSAEFFTRQSKVVYQLLQRSTQGAVLVVTHACTMHAAGRGLIGKQASSLSLAEMRRVPFNYPYCSALAFQPNDDGRWRLAPSTLPVLNFSNYSSRGNHHFFTS